MLDGQKLLEIDCLDRVYLTMSVPNLVVGGQVVSFLNQHEGMPVPSPALLERRGQTFRRAVMSFAEANDIPVISFTGRKEKTRPGVLAGSPWPERKIDQVMPLMRKAAATGRSQVVAIGVAQEYQRVFTGSKSATDTGAVWFTYQRVDRRVTCYYFYLWDTDFGPAFIKICAYFPYPGKIWFNGHEWAKRQAAKAGISFRELSNGFAACEDPHALQDICDRLGPGTITVFAERWSARLPLPFTPADRAAGYWWDISMRQIEVAKTIVFTAPRHAAPSSKPSPRTTSTSAAPTTWRSSSTGRSAPPPKACSAPPSTATTTASWSTPSTGTHGSSTTSKTAGRYASRPSSTTPTTSVCCAVWNTSTRSSPKPVTPTAGCWTLSVPVRAASLRAQSSNGSHSPPSPRMAGGPQRYASPTLGSWP
ncbi:hypothetical protein ONA91_39145 [Micromonospora sp. DR5-3]|uniref:hypothetical protein n=1 Tax=unclassified Micromonospora TaxID=2617518 RepID=UPI001CA379E9|nr:MULTISPECIES: hypothetical protein [unclassified Micromonospora]MCW3820465.1 hypothetical protein [Micromonospora sp. DR5-3]